MSQLKTCPNCNSPLFAEILYGMPDYDNDLEQAIEEGKIVLGGCIISDNDPDYQCLVCKAFIFSKTSKFEIREDDEE